MMPLWLPESGKIPMPRPISKSIGPKEYRIGYVNAEVPKPDGKHNQVNTRKELKAYDRGLYDILSEFFPATNEQISCHKYINKYRK